MAKHLPKTSAIPADAPATAAEIPAAAPAPIVKSRGRKRSAELPAAKNVSVSVGEHGGAKLNFRDVARIEAVKNNDNSSVIVFEKIKPREIKGDNFEEIGVDRATGALSNVVAAGTQIAAAMTLSSMGLFRASVTPKILAMFADGNFSTFSTVFSQSKTVVAQVGLKTISATVFAPIAVMQLLAMVTGQYYMSGINRQLNDIANKINQLIKFHHTEKISRLENAQELLRDLFNVRNPSIEHLTQLKTMEYEIGSIFREYAKYLDEIDYDFLKEEGLKFFSKKDVVQLLKTEDESGFALNLYMVVTADEILHLLPIIELVINVKLNTISGDRSNQISELYEKINSWAPDDFFAHQRGRDVLDRYFEPFIERAKRIRCSCWSRIGGSRVDKSIADLENRREKILNAVLNSGRIYELRDQLIDYMNQPVELLYAGNGENGALYVKRQRIKEETDVYDYLANGAGAEEVNENYAL